MAENAEPVILIRDPWERKRLWHEAQANLPIEEKVRIIDKLHRRAMYLARVRKELGES